MEINENVVNLVGKIINLKEDYSYKDEKFYNAEIEVDRLSGTPDILPITIPGKLLFRNDLAVGDYVSVEGEIRMYNCDSNGKHNIFAYAFVKDITTVDEATYESCEERNYVKLEGYVCNSPRHRITTKTNRQITDMLIANNRNNRKSFYIPTISWGNTSIMASKLMIGDKVLIEGRFQSRRYQADPLNGKPEDYSVQEISATKIEVLKTKEIPENRYNETIDNIEELGA